MSKAVLLISHGKLAYELKNTLEMIVGSNGNLYCVGLDVKENIHDFEKKLDDILEKLINYKDVLIFADLYGGSPCNTTLKYLSENKHYEIISGMNLPMVLSAVLNPNEKIESLINIGRNAIIDIRSVYENMSDDEE